MSDTVQAALVSGIFLVLVAIVSLIPQMVRQHRDIRDVKHQVQNSHGTNLRDDIDGLHRSVTWGFAAVHQRLNALTSDLDVERRERVALAERVEKK